MKRLQKVMMKIVWATLFAIGIAGTALANDEKYKAVPLQGSSNQLAKDSSSTVSDTVFFNTSLNPLITGSSVRNIITFKINEYANIVLPGAFTVKLKFKIDLYSTISTYTTVYDSLTITYDEDSTYRNTAVRLATGGYKAVVTITHDPIVTGASAGDVLPALLLENEIWVTREYDFDCSNNALQYIYKDVASIATDGELKVWWAKEPTATEYDLEWSYVDSTARTNYYIPTTTNFDADKIFAYNATRVTLKPEEYMIPLMYDNGGILFFRVRPVKVNAAGQRFEADWSSDYTNGLGRYDFAGHERGLNWQATTSFAEDGKRKTVVQYFDGSLRGRQTVTKDNTTQTTVVAESFYDYQGRPVIQILPAPTLDKIIKFTPGFNRLTGAGSDQRDLYDPELSLVSLCGSAAPSLNNAYGAALYYSISNTLNNTGYHKYIPDAQGYAYTETQYSTDGTDRVLKQSGVGEKYRLNGGKETRYYYASADQEDLDLLFGTEAGAASHYSKNMVRDANGQYSVSYVDMHGRTVATALAGDVPRDSANEPVMDTLLSKNIRNVTKKMLDANNNIINGHSITSIKTLLVPQQDAYRFQYSLHPDSLSLGTCDSSTICYDCMYDLEITIWGECYNSSVPLVIRRNNLRINPVDTVCSTPNIGLAVDTVVTLTEGDYTVTKTLTISRPGFEYLRDSVYLKRNLCKTVDSFIEATLDSLRANMDCEQTCSTCLANLGTWDDFRDEYMSGNGIGTADSAGYRDEAWQAYLEQQKICDELCDNVGLNSHIRDAMLADLTPPAGQYADPTAIDEFSIFKKVGGIRRYQSTIIIYKNTDGTVATGINAGGETVSVNELDMPQFIDQFQPQWAESLLPLHPEYCKLQVIEAAPFPDSYLWDEQFQAVETFSEARAKGYLNPTNNNTAPFNQYPLPGSTNRDPLFISNTTWREAMEDNMLVKMSHAPTSTEISIWAMATIMAHCPAGNEDCVNEWQDTELAFDSTILCRPELDQAWQLFREMYMNEKRKIITSILAGECNPMLVIERPHYSHFADFDQAVALGSGGGPFPNAGAAQDSLDALIDANCQSYIPGWWQQLESCGFNSTDSAVIIPKLLNVCKEGGDVTHFFGSSTVRPASTSTDRSFEQVIKDYCDLISKPYDITCNAFLITAPRPYGQQNVFVDEVVTGTPDSCQCARIEQYHGDYYRYRQNGESFADYLARTINSSLTQGELDTLQMACGDSVACRFLPHPIVLPPAFQCAVTGVCLTCMEVRTLEQQYYTEFPGQVPVKVPATEEEEKINQVFAAFMNNKTGFSKLAIDYLNFLDSCPPLPGGGCDSLLQILQDFNYHHAPGHASYVLESDESDIFTDPDDIFENGIMRFPAAVRTEEVAWYNNFGVNFTPALCLEDGFEIETRMKLLQDAPYSLTGHIFYLNPLFNGGASNNPIFSRYTNAQTIDGTYYPNGLFMLENIGGGIQSGQSQYAVCSANPNRVFDWFTVKIRFDATYMKIYYEGRLIKTLLRNSSGLSNLINFGWGIRSRQGAVDYIKIRDHNQRLVYFEDFNNMVYPARIDPTAFCDTLADCETAFTTYFNSVKDSSLTYGQIMALYQDSCGYQPVVCPPGNSGPLLCGKLETSFPITTDYDTPCSDSTQYAIELGTQLYNYYRDSLTRAFEDAYIQKCLQNASKESFTVTHTQSEYHYTLYWYDQAGNLVKTVPPQGVDNWFTYLKEDASYGNSNFTAGVNTWLDEVESARSGATLKNISYTFPTQYRFNTLNQVVKQKSPDGGLSKFWYDRLDRLVVSQNAKQAAPATESNKLYSYTLYDYLGRISEVGQLENNEGTAMSQTISRDAEDLADWIADNATAKEQVTRTYYDNAPDPSLLNDQLTPRNLRNRVAYTTLTDGAGTADAGYNYAAFYTYDIHGNVDTLVHDYGLGTAPPVGSVNVPNMMNMNGNRYKSLVYSYDLVSGKVNGVQYQPGHVDRFYHAYEYDAENRITDVLTSTDGIIWEKDARYQYYKHGPLARTVLGQQQVQGLDYAYTLQGWLKGVNSTGIHSTPGTQDMGGDGLSSGSNQYIAQDALAFNLNYFAGDYTPINKGVTPFATVSAAQISSFYRPLYNGNISSMAVSIGKFDNTWLYNYKYDQLNRIREMDVFEDGYQQDQNVWGTPVDIGMGLYDPLMPGTNYQERVQYDANGNIVNYLRNQTGNNTTRQMDDLQYWYQYKTTGGSINYYNPLAPLPGDVAELTNKLSYVDDNVDAANSTADIDDQDEDNYLYDEIGNLVTDAQSNIVDIEWTVYGKIKIISFDHFGTGKTRRIYYTYDAAGNRIGKRVEKYTAGSDRLNEYTWYVRDAQGNVMATYNYSNTLGTEDDYSEHLSENGLVLSEHHLYGSSRLGILTHSLDAEAELDEENIVIFERGHKFFELSNHLGNVLTTIGDQKVPGNTTVGDPVTYYKPVIITASDYYPFGMLMPERNYKLNDAYRYGFNGKENDNDVKGEGNQQDYGMRIYDPRLGKFLSVDPITAKYPELTPYQFASNRPIDGIDQDGLEFFEYLKGVFWDNGLKLGIDWFNENLNPLVPAVEAITGKSYASNFTEDKDRGLSIAEVILFANPVTKGEQVAMKPFVVEGAETVSKQVLRQADNLAVEGAARQAENVAVQKTSSAMSKPVAWAMKKNITIHAATTGAAKAVVKKESNQLTKNEIGNVLAFMARNAVCFVAGTKILTQKGLKNIEEIRVGDSVWAFNDFTHKIALQSVFNTVTKKTHQLINLKIGKEEIWTTPEHPFWIRNKWVKALDIITGDSVNLFDRTKAMVNSVFVKDTIATVYNFAVEKFNTYYVSGLGILVHNNNPCATSIPKNRWITRSVYKELGEILGKQWQQAFARAKDKGLALTRKGDNGIIALTSQEIKEFGGKYTYKLKVAKAPNHTRILGRIDDKGNLVFDKIINK